MQALAKNYIPTSPEVSDLSDAMAAECCQACGGREIVAWLDGFLHHYHANGLDKTWKYCFNECKTCGLGFIAPMPDWSLLQTFYQRDYHCYGEDNHVEHPLKYRIARYRFAGSSSKTPAALAKRGFGIATEWLSGKTITYSLGIPLQLPLDAKIFEMGYGSGYWLKAMSNLGYKHLYGYDIDPNSFSRDALKSLGVTLSAGDFLQNHYQPDHFDCIRLEHVFEHLLCPIEVLRKCRDMLKPNGNLVMTLPCKSSWSRSISSRHWGPLEPPVHLLHHTPDSVSNMFRRLGFVIKGLKPYSVTSQLVGTINNVLTSRGKRLPSSGATLLRLLSPAYRGFGRLTARGDFMTVWATKPLEVRK